MLDTAHRLTTYGSAPDGHVTPTAACTWTTAAHHLALGFGTTTARAGRRRRGCGSALTGHGLYECPVGALRQPPAPPFVAAWRVGRARYYAVGQCRQGLGGQDVPRRDRRRAGLAVGPGGPGRQSDQRQPTYFGSYREVFARDLYEAFTGLLVAGDIATARSATTSCSTASSSRTARCRATRWRTARPAPDTGGLQLDETSYPILMAWQAGLAGDADLYRNHVIPAADFLVAHGPSDGVGALGGAVGLLAVDDLGRDRRPDRRGAHRDGQPRPAPRGSIRRPPTTSPATSGLGRHDHGRTRPRRPSYFIRLSKNGDPTTRTRTASATACGNVDQRSVIDAGFLDLVRLGILPATDPVVRSSLRSSTA